MHKDFILTSSSPNHSHWGLDYYSPDTQLVALDTNVDGESFVK